MVLEFRSCHQILKQVGRVFDVVPILLKQIFSFSHRGKEYLLSKSNNIKSTLKNHSINTL